MTVCIESGDVSCVFTISDGTVIICCATPAHPIISINAITIKNQPFLFVILLSILQFPHCQTIEYYISLLNITFLLHC